MDESFLKQIGNEILSFSIKLDEQIKALITEGLISVEEQEHLKLTALRYREALESSLSISTVTPIQKSLITSLVQDYEQNISADIAKIINRRYSEKRIKARIEESIQAYISEISSELSQQSKVLTRNRKMERAIDNLRINTLKNLINQLKKSSQESEKSILVEKSLESLKKDLNIIFNNYFTEKISTSDNRTTNNILAEQREMIPKGTTWTWLKREKDMIVQYFSPNNHFDKESHL